ncbi:connector enhancer of kinase suppressor of ras 1-like [Ascaphus truei]|uniref:connector enhancer of kinase suppressor of ras 1-like n=1 Tax=Ascaphus truei TaxID=8439 RepID=UPI003F5AAB88
MQTVQPQTKNVSGAESPTSRKEREATGGGQSPGASNAQPEGDSLESLISCLKQGGVSLIGKKTPLTHDEYRKSFIRRNNNPDINRRAHTLRTLHSTLKAKLSELQALNQILENPNINSAIFQRWKAEHGQLYGSPGQERRGREESVGKEEKGGESATSD